MCFSASVSFGAGVVLMGAGIAVFRKVRDPNHYLFASIPILFGVQQIIEGILWISLTNEAYSDLASGSTWMFLFFAQVLWPLYVPLSIWKLESSEKYKRILGWLLGIGTMVSIYLGFCLISFEVKGSIVGHHISYFQDYPVKMSNIGGILYVIATILPPFFTRIKKMWLLGAAILMSYIVTQFLFSNYVVSVWCFFAAVISLMIYWLINQINLKKFKEEN